VRNARLLPAVFVCAVGAKPPLQEVNDAVMENEDFAAIDRVVLQDVGGNRSTEWSG